MTDTDFWQIARTALDVIGALYLLCCIVATIDERYGRARRENAKAARDAELLIAEERRARRKAEMRLQGDPVDRVLAGDAQAAQAAAAHERAALLAEGGAQNALRTGD